jgi:enterochelin esterase-like enzyme
MSATVRTSERPGGNRVALWALGAAVAIVATSAGLIGTYHYLDNYWLYRGYAPPKDPTFVATKGRLVSFKVRSVALGGRRQLVDVYLPPGYAAHPTMRFPVVYLLHGFPGVPPSFFRALRLGVLEDVLVAEKRMRPVILVAPYGSTGPFTDKEWANGVRKHEGWETFVAHDVVHAIDARFRTIRAGWARALAGLSEGGYGALNIGLHHPAEFKVLESWSGYVYADDIASIFGRKQALLRYNSPADTLPAAAPALRAAHTYIWSYSGSADKHLLPQNRQFARELERFRIASHYAVVPGGHDWALWRGLARKALYAAVTRLVPAGSRGAAGAAAVRPTGSATAPVPGTAVPVPGTRIAVPGTGTVRKGHA